jgi:phosphoribosylformimino-5-aminoimidazole carboxamide ribotide isomerase
VIPVIDILNGQAVRAIGGDRAAYRPLRSLLSRTCDPLEVSRAYRDALGLTTQYVADLDAVTRRTPNLRLLRTLDQAEVSLWIDLGLRTEADAAPLLTLDHPTLVIGLETIQHPGDIEAIVRRAGSDRVVLSLDLINGDAKIANPPSWPSTDPPRIAEHAIDLGVTQILLLDLTRIGKGQGTGTSRLASELQERFPDVTITVGGGVSSIDDVKHLRDAGISSVLVGSAFHDGRIGLDELRQLDE